MAKNFEWGFTLILHPVKKHFDLSADEYIYMDMIARQAAEFGGWTYIAIGAAAAALGVSQGSIKLYNSRLKQKGLLTTKEAEQGEAVGKQGSKIWWEAINNVKTTPSQNLTTPSQNLTTPSQNLTTPSQNLTTIYNTNNNSNIDSNNIDEKSKDFSYTANAEKKAAPEIKQPTSEPNDQTATAGEKEKSCAKKEKAEKFKKDVWDMVIYDLHELSAFGDNGAAVNTVINNFKLAICERIDSGDANAKKFKLDTIKKTWANTLKRLVASTLGIAPRFDLRAISDLLGQFANSTWQSPFYNGYISSLTTIYKQNTTLATLTQTNQNGENTSISPTGGYSNSNINIAGAMHYLQDKPDF